VDRTSNGISISSEEGHLVLDIEGNNMKAGTTVILSSRHGRDNQIFEVISMRKWLK
jgi:hypothetical protein